MKAPSMSETFLNKNSEWLDCKIPYRKLSRDVTNADTGTSTPSTHRWRTNPNNDLMNMFSHSPTPELTTSDLSRWSSYDVPRKEYLQDVATQEPLSVTKEQFSLEQLMS